MKPRRFSETLPVRLPVEVDRRLRLVSLAVGITKSDALRLAVNIGLPDLEAGRISLRARVTPLN